MNALQHALAALRLGRSETHRNLSVVALLAHRALAPDDLLLEEALREGVASVTETSDFGTVPQPRLRNHGDRPVLLVDGEDLVGAKQNRVLNITLLVGAAQAVLIPVSCVEQGRWAWRTPEFATGGRTLFAAARARKMGRVSQENQGEVWHDIGRKLSALQARSPSMSISMSDAYRDAFHPVAGQVGAAFGIDGRIVGVELFDAQATFATFLPVH